MPKKRLAIIESLTRAGFCLALLALAAFLPLRSAAAENDKIYGPTAPSNFIIYALDPELLAGWNTPLRDYEKAFIAEKYQRLPILGGWYGEGFIPDREVLLAAGLKKAFFLTGGIHENLGIAPALEALGMSVVTGPGGLRDSAECFRLMGRAYARQERGEALAAYAEAALAKVDKALAGLPAEKRPRVYMAMQADGLATVCRGSERAEPLEMAGGDNVHECLPGTENSALHITFEQLLAYDPDVILVYHPGLARRIPGDANWKRLRAVREGRLYLMPRGPFTWLERPATYMRLIGVQWLANALHPELLPLDMKAETKTFMKLFFHADLSDEQVEIVLDPLKEKARPGP